MTLAVATVCAKYFLVNKKAGRTEGGPATALRSGFRINPLDRLS